MIEKLINSNRRILKPKTYRSFLLRLLYYNMKYSKRYNTTPCNNISSIIPKAIKYALNQNNIKL